MSETVEAEFRRLGFFEAVAVLGQGGLKLRFRAAASLAFPAHEIAAAGWEEGLNGEPRFTLTVPFLGLYGPASPLPTFYTERLLQDEPASWNQRDFLDIFNHVAIALLVQIHQRTRAPIEVDSLLVDDASHAQRGGRRRRGERVFRNVLRLAGLPAISEAPQRPQGPDTARLGAMVSLLAFRRGSAVELERTISYFLGGATVRVEEWIPRRVPLPDAQLSRLGQAPSRLGAMVMGRGGVDPGAAIRLCIDHLDAVARAALLPGEPGHARLATLLRRLVPPGLEMELCLRGPDAAPFRMGLGGARLGLDSKLGAQDRPGELLSRVVAA